MYNMVFGVNPFAGILLAAIRRIPRSQAWKETLEHMKNGDPDYTAEQAEEKLLPIFEKLFKRLE